MAKSLRMADSKILTRNSYNLEMKNFRGDPHRILSGAAATLAPSSSHDLPFPGGSCMILRAARVIGIVLFFLCALSFGQTNPSSATPPASKWPVVDGTVTLP